MTIEIHIRDEDINLVEKMLSQRYVRVRLDEGETMDDVPVRKLLPVLCKFAVLEIANNQAKNPGGTVSSQFKLSIHFQDELDDREKQIMELQDEIGQLYEKMGLIRLITERDPFEVETKKSLWLAIESIRKLTDGIFWPESNIPNSPLETGNGI